MESCGHRAYVTRCALENPCAVRACLEGFHAGSALQSGLSIVSVGAPEGETSEPVVFASGDSQITIRMTTATEWRERRELRLEMLADTPIAFRDALETARGFSEEQWRFWARRAVSPGNCTAVAVADRTWVGTMSAFVAADTRAVLVTVYVSPAFRGRPLRVADRLLDYVEQWVAARTTARALVLTVHEDNNAAQAFYRRRGFEPTGRTEPYPLDPSRSELEFQKPVPRPDAS